MSTREHAVVMGASMAGLLTARVLASHFARVTIVERDTLPVEAEHRKGVPQGRHAHGLLVSGARVLEQYFPGLTDEIVARGGLRGDVMADVIWCFGGRYMSRANGNLAGVVASRPLLEGAVRDRVRALPNVTVRDGVSIESPVYDASAGRVAGVRIEGSPEPLTADLVVDCTGRGSQTPKWLKEWGFEPPFEERVDAPGAYVSRVFERHPADLGGATGAIVGGEAPHDRRGAAMLAADRDRWVVTLFGCLGDYPPTDEAGWIEFARGLAAPDIANVVSRARPLGPLETYRFPGNQWRHFERLKAFPGGYLVLGDGICGFNPVYGQGMSVAALEARSLDTCLAAGDDALARRFFKAAATPAKAAWTLAAGEDLRFPDVAGKRAPGAGLINAYMDRLRAVASADPVVCTRFFEVASLLRPAPSVFAPRIFARVLLGRRKATSRLPLPVRLTTAR